MVIINGEWKVFSKNMMGGKEVNSIVHFFGESLLK
jgi:hypothetical protein